MQEELCGTQCDITLPTEVRGTGIRPGLFDSDIQVPAGHRNGEESCGDHHTASANSCWASAVGQVLTTTTLLEKPRLRKVKKLAEGEAAPGFKIGSGQTPKCTLLASKPQCHTNPAWGHHLSLLVTCQQGTESSLKAQQCPTHLCKFYPNASLLVC